MPSVIMPQTSRVLQSTVGPLTKTNLKMIHVIAIFFTGIMIVVSALLGAQYIFRYRKYKKTASFSEQDSPAHTPRTSIGSVANEQLNSRAISTTTLISEVVYMVKIRPRGQFSRHSRLRESVDGEALEHGKFYSKPNR